MRSNPRSRSRRAILPLATAALVLAGSAPAQVAALAQVPAPGRRIDVGGHRLHIHCLGEGGPTVVIDAGAGGWSIFYRGIQERVAAETRTCAYDRAGLGWSEPGPAPRTSARMAEELHALLDGAGLEPPFVLVGHSLGGYNARLFADRYPAEVAGVVLAESAHEEQWERLPHQARDLVPAAAEGYRGAAEAARAGTLPAGSVPPWPFPEQAELRAVYEAEMASPETYEAMAAEMAASVESAAEVAGTGDLGGLPLAVVTARNSFAAFEGTGIPIAPANEAWLAMQEELVGLSTAGIQFWSDRGDHHIHRTDPGLVVEAILHVVRAARETARADPLRPMPTPVSLRTLPGTSDPATDWLLAELEVVYAEKDVEGFVGLFTDDFTQVDVNRRVYVRGKDDWRRQTEQINAAHREMGRLHHGRVRVGDWVIAEIEWWGTVDGAALAAPDDRSYRYSGIGLLEVDDGKIGRQILYADHRTLEEQLGQRPEP
jgi:pimeloyl-ACP methyl ester carboxylesterase/ketosteroid isomerase-like protein